jgi:hypothetical protein
VSDRNLLLLSPLAVCYRQNLALLDQNVPEFAGDLALVNRLPGPDVRQKDDSAWERHHSDGIGDDLCEEHRAMISAGTRGSGIR